MLDAPALQDDFYLNLLDWSATNIISICLENTVYIWNASTSNASKIYETADPGNLVSSVAWNFDGS